MLQQLQPPPANPSPLMPPGCVHLAYPAPAESSSSSALGLAIRAGGRRDFYRDLPARGYSTGAATGGELVDPPVVARWVQPRDEEHATSAAAVAFITQTVFGDPEMVVPEGEEKSRQRQLFRHELLRSLELEPVEAGFAHPATRIMEDAITRFGATALGWIMGAYFSNHRARPALAADILRCVGRLPLRLIRPWGPLMAISGLLHRDPEIREAAVRAFEFWGGRDSIAALQARVDAEPLPWLAGYMRQVIADLAD
jgi:hypothetical protein